MFVSVGDGETRLMYRPLAVPNLGRLVDLILRLPEVVVIRIVQTGRINFSEAETSHEVLMER